MSRRHDIFRHFSSTGQMSACDGHGTPVACPENRVAWGTRRDFRGAYLITLTPHTQNTNERHIYHPDHGRQPPNSGPNHPNPYQTPPPPSRMSPRPASVAVALIQWPQRSQSPPRLPTSEPTMARGDILPPDGTTGAGETTKTLRNHTTINRYAVGGMRGWIMMNYKQQSAGRGGIFAKNTTIIVNGRGRYSCSMASSYIHRKKLFT